MFIMVQVYGRIVLLYMIFIILQLVDIKDGDTRS